MHGLILIRVEPVSLQELSAKHSRTLSFRKARNEMEDALCSSSSSSSRSSSSSSSSSIISMEGARG